MANDRCPSCAAVVRAGDPWCTLCWTDLRPAPVPAAPAAAPAPVAVAAVPVQGVPVQAGPVAVPHLSVDPLSAPLAVVLGEAPPVAEVGATPTWPCVQCGAANSIDLDRCATCATPFGGRIRRLDDVKGQRRKTMLVGLGAVGAFLLLLGALTFAATDTSNARNDKAPPGVDFAPVN